MHINFQHWSKSTAVYDEKILIAIDTVTDQSHIADDYDVKSLLFKHYFITVLLNALLFTSNTV